MGAVKTVTSRASRQVIDSGDIRPDEVKAIRYKLMQTQDEFAEMIGVSVSTLLAWETGTQHPDGPALALLRVASKNPKTVAKALGH